MFGIWVGIELCLLICQSNTIVEGVYLFGMDTPVVVLGEMPHKGCPAFIELATTSAVEQYFSLDEMASPAGCLDRNAGAS